MSFKLSAIVILFLLPQFTVAQPLAQSNGQQIQTESQLASALTSQPDKRSRDELLKTHPQLVTVRLWDELKNSAAAAYYQQSPQRSLQIYEVLIQVATELHDGKLLAITYYNLGRTYSGLNQFPAAIGAYEKSREYFAEGRLQRDLIYVLADLGALHFIQEDYEKARTYSEQSLSIASKIQSTDPPGAWPDDFGRARALQTLAEIDTRNGDSQKAIQKLHESLALYQRLGRETSGYDFYIGGVYAGLGRAYPEIGDAARALVYFGKALEIAKAQLDPNVVAGLRNDIGVLYLEQEDYAQANAQFAESLKIYVAKENQREAARVLLNLGVVEQRRANYDEALRYFRQSLQAAKATGIADVQIADHEGIGVVLTAKKDFHGAIDTLNKGLMIARTLSDKMRQTEITWRLAQVYHAMGDHARSTTLAESAVTLARSSHLPKLTYLATTTLGEVYAAQQKYDLAIETLTQAVEQLEALREQVAGTELETQLFLENKVTAYHTLVDLFIKQGKPLDALMHAERAKGRVLLDVLKGDRAGLGKVLTPREKEEAQRLNRKIFEINSRIKTQAAAVPASLNSLYAQLDTARLEYQSFQDALYVAHPDLRIRSGHTAVLSKEALNQLGRNTDCAYLEFIVGQDQVLMFVLARSKDGGPDLKVYPIAARPDDLLRKVDQFHERLAHRHPDYTSAARELYSLLIEPAAPQLRNFSTICIVPDGFLWNLPFQALITGSGHYLIEDHEVYYAPSLSVLREMTKGKVEKERGPESIIAFANPVIAKDERRNEDLCPLPEAEKEAASVAKTFSLTGSKVLIGRSASEKAFKALAPGYSVIHLSTHGVLDNRQPLYSHLLLTRTDGDPENDGLLEAREIMQMQLNSDLAVLSACETANGKISPGEGVIGMSWAFFVASCRSMLVSQWDVNSASTSQLMVTFYHSLQSDRHGGNGRKATALRAAALRLMKDKRFRHPFYWAGFVLVGSNG